MQQLTNHPLFQQIPSTQLPDLLTSLHVHIKSYNKHSTIIQLHQTIPYFGIVLAGSIRVSTYDEQGNERVLNHFTNNDIFAEVFVCTHVLMSPVEVSAQQDCQIAWIQPYTNSAHPSYFIFMQNLMQLLAQKNLMMMQKNEILGKRYIRDRLLLYFQFQQSKNFTLPFNQEQLAAYLSVERSALSNELNKMRKEKLISYQKNEFTLLY